MYHTIFIFYLHNYGHKRYTCAIMSPVMKEMKKLFVLCILLCTLFGCTEKEPVYNKYPKVILGFDTMITMNAYATNDKDALSYSQILENAFNKYNQLFDKYNDYEGVNNIKTINDNAGKQKVTVEQPIIDLLLLAKEYTEITNGTFDITMGNTMVLWHNYRDQGEQINLSGSDDVPLPTTKELQESAKYAGWKYVEIDDENNTVYITNENVSLDVGAIAKGYTTEVVAQELEKAGMLFGNVNGGGNVRVVGNKADGKPWGVGIANPNDPYGDTVTTIYTGGNMSVVTSGDYQRYFVSNGKIYSHIIDPDTLFPATHHRSVTIVTEDSGVADILSTALYVMDLEEGLQFVENYNKTQEKPVAVVWVYDVDNHPESSLGKELNGVYIVATENIQANLRGFGK